MVLDILRASTFNLGLGFKFCLRGKCLRRLAVLLGEVCGFGAQGGFTFQVSTPKALQPPKNATRPQSPNSPKMSETRGSSERVLVVIREERHRRRRLLGCRELGGAEKGASRSLYRSL